MKTAKNIALKSIIALITILSLSMASNYATPAAAADSEGEATFMCGVTEADVIKYLDGHGYTVERLTSVEGCCDIRAYTQNSYTTRVFIKDRTIITHEDEL
jgi:hypothetical protein